jgi:hypothetical protein
LLISTFLKMALFCTKLLIAPVSKLINLKYWFKLKLYRKTQMNLYNKFGLAPSDSIHEYDEFTRNNIEKVACKHIQKNFIYTSGSTNKPKKILYTKKRLRDFKKISQDIAVNILYKFRGKYPNVFVMASLKDDDSFTSLVLKNENSFPSLLKGATDPASYLRVKEIKDLAYIYDINSLRLLLIIITRPSILYSTNPSTLAVFLSTITNNWDEVKKVLLDFLEKKDGFNNHVIEKMLKRHGHIQFQNMLRKISILDTPDWELIFPELKVICCWDGG